MVFNWASFVLLHGYTYPRVVMYSMFWIVAGMNAKRHFYVHELIQNVLVNCCGGG